MQDRAKGNFATLAPYILTFAVWGYFALLHAVPYWQERGDYSWYSLSYAFTFESDYAGHPASNYGFGVHPGIPFGLASWVAFRIATLGIGPSAHRIAFAIAHADWFWGWAKAVALLLNFAGIYFLQCLLGRNTARFWLGLATYFSIVTAAFGLSLVQLTNESFALPFVAGYYLLVWKFFRAENAQTGDVHPAFAFSSREGLALAAGVAAAFGCSIKIYYLAPAVGFAFGLVIASVCGNQDWRMFFKSCALWLCGFLLMGILIISHLMSWSTFETWALWNWEMLDHVDRYASGAKGVFSSNNVLAAFSDLSRSSWFRFPAILLAAVLATIAVVASNLKSAPWRKNTLPYLASVSLGLLISLFGLLKHYSPLSQHYALPFCATLPCLLVFMKEHDPRSYLLKIGAVVAAILCAANIGAYASQHQAKLDLAHAIIADNLAIDALPITAGHKRVWVYFSATRPGVTPMINDYAGSAFVSEAMPGSNSVDISPFSDRNVADWEYVIFPKTSFPTADVLRSGYRKQFDLAETDFQIRDSDTIKEYRNFFVLTRMP